MQELRAKNIAFKKKIIQEYFFSSVKNLLNFRGNIRKLKPNKITSERSEKTELPIRKNLTESNKKRTGIADSSIQDNFNFRSK